MTEPLYRLATLCGRLFGTWLFVCISRAVAAGYFVFSPRVAASTRFYAMLFPDRSRWFHRLCTFRQYQNFTTIHLDRFLAARRVKPSFTSEGMEKLDAVIGGRGGILLMSHLGNWEIAAHLLKQQRKDLRMLLYMGVKEKEGVERLQKEELRHSGVRVIGIDQGHDAPFSAVEGIRCLRSGGMVSMSGDIVWRSDQRTVRVSFLGREAALPAAPYVFALLTGAPLFVFFAFRTGRNSYHFTASDPIEIGQVPKTEREEAIAAAAQKYADLLEKTLKKHPFEWYHFKRFV